jgi:hypothetical protein
MFKYLSICAAFVALAAGPVYAQKQEAVLRHIEVPGTDFNFVVASPKPGAGILQDLGNMPEALVVHLQGGALAVVFDDAGEMIKALDLLQAPAIDFRVETDRGGTPQPVALYIVSKVRGLPAGGEMMTLQEFENFRSRTVVINPDHGVEVPFAQASATPR